MILCLLRGEQGGPINDSAADHGSRVPAAGLCGGAPAALFFGQSRLVVGAAGPEAARTAFPAGDFGLVYQLVAVFDLLGMVATTVRARGHLSPVELLVHCCTLGISNPGAMRAPCLT